MNRKELFKNLNKLCRDLDTKYNINCGGCCFVAAVIAEQLENHDIPFKVIHYDMWHCHYAIRVNDRIINRCSYSFKEIVFDDTMCSDELFSTYNNENWNDEYNTCNNNFVRSEIKSLFEKYENRRKRFHNGRCIS